MMLSDVRALTLPSPVLNRWIERHEHERERLWHQLRASLAEDHGGHQLIASMLFAVSVV